jgi:ligand-binding sensor domain-containing protein
MRSKFRFSLNVAFYLCACISLSHAQWVKTSGPDSVRTFTHGRVKLAEGGDALALFAGTTQGIFRSLDDGVNWVPMNGGLTSPLVRALAIFRDTLFAGTQGGGIYRSANGGVDWVTVNTGLTNLNVRTLLVHGIDFYAGTDSGKVFRSMDKGTTWSLIGTGMTDAAVNGLAFYHVSLFAGTEGGGVFRSANNGASWSAVNSGLTSLTVHCLRSDGTAIHAGTDSGVFKLPPHSENWSLGNLGDGAKPKVQAMTSTVVLNDLPVFLFAGTRDSGVFVSDHGIDWASINTGLTDLNVRAVGVQTYEFVFAATDQGVWRRPLSEVTTSIRGKPIVAPGDFRINLSGSVTFSLTSPTRVTLTAHTLSGRRVAVLLEREFSAGTHTHLVNAEGVPKGLYVYRLEAGAVVKTRKVVLAR